MVVLGGLEIAAVGYLLNEFNKDKIQERERRKQSQSQHNHDDRPHSRPHSNSRPPPPPQHQGSPHTSNANLLGPPQAPLRPLSAPPQDPRPEWQRQQGYQQQQGPFQQGPPMPPPGPQGNEYAFQSQLWQRQQAQQAQQHRPSQPSHMPPNSNPLWQAGPQPGPQGPGQFNGPPGPGYLQRPQTFQPGQGPPPNQPYIQASNTFPQQQQFQQPHQLQHSGTFPMRPQGPPQQQFRPQTVPAPQQSQAKPPPTGPLVYINTKTGKVSHNLYPVDHPMYRASTTDVTLSNGQNRERSGSGSIASQSGPYGNADDQPIPREFWGDEKYRRTMAGDIHTGLMWSEKDEDDLAYGKDYTTGQEQRRRRRSTRDREFSYERVRTNRRDSDLAY